MDVPSTTRVLHEDLYSLDLRMYLLHNSGFFCGTLVGAGVEMTSVMIVKSAVEIWNHRIVNDVLIGFQAAF